MATIAVIGSGFSGLSAAAYLAKQGHTVNVYEKNATPGGRARTFTANGYLFDMGPSWYWMPDVFEKFFADFGYEVSELYRLEKLDPAFEMIFGGKDRINVPADFNALCEMFNGIEPGSDVQLKKFMEEAAYKYKAGVENLVYKPGLSLFEFAEADIIMNMFRLQVFSSFSKHVNKYFKDARLRALMEFPVLFLGAMPSKTPALYSLMNYAGLKLGTWYPQGGFGKVISAMLHVCIEKRVNFFYNSPVEEIIVTDGIATGVRINGNVITCDAVVASADYHHVEDKLLAPALRNYSNEYWNKKTFAPSCLIFYIGLTKKIEKLRHHTLFFEESLLQHSIEIYEAPQWPTKPLFYVCCPSKTDATVAPKGHENLFLLMPIAPGLTDSEAEREKYFSMMLRRIEEATGEDNLSAFIDYKKSYCVSDFIEDYNSYKGNAYGLANTLLQTAVFKPKIRNKKVKNLFYTGQLTVPGPGVPPSIISGKIASQQSEKYLNSKRYEATI